MRELVSSPIQAVLHEYLFLLDERLPNMVEGLYLHGSLALNAYVEGSSDIDFLTVIKRRLTKNEMNMVAEIHNQFAKKYPTPQLDGVYILWDDIGKEYSADQSNIYYNDGVLSYGPYFNFNPITWWTLKTNGIKVRGPETALLKLDVSPHQITTYVINNMNSYWTNWVRRNKDSLKELLDLETKEIEFEIEWSVLGLLRQYYTLKEKDIISKLGAGEYALRHVPEKWHQIIEEAINIRSGKQERFYDSKEEQIMSAITFSEEIIRFSNQHFHNEQLEVSK
ncbi:aminoglycoside adenylyltransferase domain-containing protein [Bacillus spongiae]|uniref:Aminoglycoside adenylyltransferase domain-containing protein n=1 Tax=Bacillus spongiae TaxID=2683610 RepID=A0ABU8HC01_9BACI